MTSSGLGSIVSASPGRVRIRLLRQHRTTEMLAQIRSLLIALPGVNSVDINGSTGSVLIRYDPAALDVAELLRLGSELGWLPREAHSSRNGLNLADWRQYVDLTRAAEGIVILGIAGLGALAGPVVGLSARAGSLSAAAAFILLRRWGRRVRFAR